MSDQDDPRQMARLLRIVPPRSLLIDQVAPGADSYVMPGQLPTDVRRRWTFYRTVRSVEQRSGGIIKLRSGFDKHPTEDTFRTFLEACERRQVQRPSSYGDCFHQRQRTPPHPRYSRKMFPTVPGGWQAVLTDRLTTREPLYQYDLRSAYLWSLAQGLPNPESFRRVKRLDGPGVYWCKSPARQGLPYPWNWEGWYPATWEEITALHLREVGAGIAFWPGSFDTGAWVNDLLAWGPDFKPIARSFWGRWANSTGPHVQTLDASGQVRTDRALRDPSHAPVWAILITARVRLRLWQLCWQLPVLRVYVDSIVTTEPMAESRAIGGWALKGYYPDGGQVRTTGVQPHAA